MAPVTKNEFLAGVGCLRYGWYARNPPQEVSESDAEKFRMEQGQEIGRQARVVWGPGEDLSTCSFAVAAKTTPGLLSQRGTVTVFEAAFQWGRLGARVDILKRARGGWELLEVKSALDPKPELVDDLAYTYLVATRAGLKVTRTTLVCVDRAYRLGGPPSDLFAEYDLTAEVVAAAADLEAVAPSVTKAVTATKQPQADLTWACKGCEHFDLCVGAGLEHPIFELPGLREGKFEALLSQGVTELGDITTPSALSDRQQRFWKAVTTGQRLSDTSALSRLDDVKWPAHYLDFETVATALPLFPDVTPYEQLPTQYSLHTCSAPGTETRHREYLADHTRYDCRALTQRLLADLGTKGSILCYASFEKTVMTSLARRYPDLAPRLQPCIDRLFDLEAVFRAGAVTDAAFRGRTSIKVILPVLVPELAYNDLSIQGGDDASTCFARLVLGQVPPQQIEKRRQALLAYCKRDTLAMVRLHGALWRSRSLGAPTTP